MRTRQIFGAFIAALLLGMPVVLASSANYYAETAVYFNVPSDATFSIALPADYTSWTTITGTEEGSATATDWISFNYTSASQPALQNPYQLGASANAQAGSRKPIFYIDSTGNVNEKFEIKYDAEPTAGISLWYNCTCTGTCAGTETTALTNMTTAYQTLTTSLVNDEYLNVTLYSNTSKSLSGGTSTINVYIKSTAL
jgi:hypothetical protein